MKIIAAIQHNQSLVAAALICFVIMGGFFACNLTKPQKEQVISTGISTAVAAATGQPLPWYEIGLMIGTILGSGAIVDNRRKDVVINQLKKFNDAKTGLLTALAGTNGKDTAQP